MRILLVAAIGICLTGCTKTMDAPSAPPQSECDAAKAEAFIGRDAPLVAEQARLATGAKAVRVIGPDQAVTMDFRPDRLNLETSADGKVVKARCG